MTVSLSPGASDKPKTAARPPISMEAAVYAIGHPLRWKLLAELAEGEPLMVTELAARLRRTVTNVSKQVNYLKSLGVISVTRRLYHISDKFPQPGEKEVDFGYFVARFGVK